MHTFQLLALSIGIYIAWTALSLYRNYSTAKITRLPIIISPVSPLNPLWILTTKLLFPSMISILQSLPIGKWPHLTYMGWQFDNKCRIHDELGPAFVLCTPAVNEIIVADPGAAHLILTKRKDFVKPPIMYDALNAFGKNLDTVECETWRRHRKLTAPSFNEKISEVVWEEAVRQASQMLKLWTDASIGNGDGVRDGADGTASLALNVLTYAGFGKKYNFKESQTKLDPPHTMSYRDALSCVLRNFTLLAVFSISALNLPFLPHHIQTVGKACLEFKLYMQETVAHEKQPTTTNSSSQTLLTSLIHASQSDSHPLTDDELYGNIFIYNMAGHETTANTITTAIAYLATHPNYQAWLREELVSTIPSGIHPPYQSTYSHLPRCQAIMLETLRLHGSIVFIPKSTTSTPPPSLLINNTNSHPLTPNTFITINSQAIHCSTSLWGSDALLWRPDRWITTTTTTPKESLLTPSPGTFLGWSDGPRICPGRKFSQVEFVAVMATLFRNHGVRTHPGEEEKLVKVIEDSEIEGITLQMRRSRDVALVWEEVNGDGHSLM